jgi:hypothetical protein
MQTAAKWLPFFIAPTGFPALLALRRRAHGTLKERRSAAFFCCPYWAPRLAVASPSSPRELEARILLAVTSEDCEP